LLHPSQQNASLLLLLLVSQRTHAAGYFVPTYSRNFFDQRAFFATKPGGGGLLKKMRLSAIDWAITLRRWNMTIPILHVEFVTAKKGRFF
jgi:hypothetical protein